jgi:hypothetical protein
MSSRAVAGVSGSRINAKFADAVTNCPGIAQIAKAQGVWTRKYPGFGANITQTCQPLCEELGLLNLEHRGVVSKRTRLVNDTTLWLNAA